MEQVDVMTNGKNAPNKKANKQRAMVKGSAGDNGKTTRFPIVGIGASAGGLEAFRIFFQNMAPDTGMAFILVTHLDPRHASGIPEILQRVTTMPVLEADDGMAVKPNHVYLIPPDKYLTISKRALRITVPEKPHGQRMPIDYFLRSLADEEGEDSICVILSGGGSDGTFGLRAVHGAGGISFVQDPTTAKQDSMPLSAIRSGLVTFVTPMDRMAEEVTAHSRKVFSKGACATLPVVESSVKTDFDELLALLRKLTDRDFSKYKSKMIHRRIQRRMNMRSIEKMDAYVQYLKKNPEEVKFLCGDLLISVTSFFRNPDAFDVMANDVIPSMIRGKPEDYEFRVWVAGCATGEEAYSIAIVLKECMERTGESVRVKIYSTDVNHQSISTARKGLYLPNIEIDVSQERLQRFFVKEEAGYRIRKDIRDMVIFAIQDVIRDPPFTRLDLISCRNLLIYLEREDQGKLVSTLHHAINPGGALFLGPSEGIGNLADLFAPISKKWKLYRTKAVSPFAKAAPFALPLIAPKPELHAGAGKAIPKEISIADLTKAALLNSFAPPAVLTDDSGNIKYVYGETGRYLRPAPGRANLNVTEMASEGLKSELRKAIKEVASKKRLVIKKNLKVMIGDRTESVDITVRPINEPGGASSILMITFQATKPRSQQKSISPRPSDSSERIKRVDDLELELSETRVNLQDAIERLQAANEELMSTNEEYQSTNEELQSTNEELQTSQEELQSVNEELTMVNSELEATNDNLRITQSDMRNLLDNTFIGTIFLDEKLAIKWFNQGSRNAFHLVDTDVGRPLADIKSTFKLEDIVTDARRGLQSLVPIEKEVETNEGNWLLARIRPYRNLDDSIGGVVLTFTDVTDLKHAKEQSEELQLYAESIVNTVRESLIVLDGDLRINSVNEAFCKTFETGAEEVVGRRIYEIGDGHWNIPELRELLERVLPKDATFGELEVEIETPATGRKIMLLNARRVMQESGASRHILLAIEDVTVERQTERALAEASRKLEIMTGVTRHDIQSQLAVVGGNLELAQMEEDRKSARNLTDKAIAAARKIDALIQFTKNYQKVGFQKPIWQNIRVVLRNTVAGAPRHGVRIENDLPEVEVFADPLLPETFDNLIDNSVRHGARTKVIRFASEVDDNSLMITCEDDGVGISAEEKKIIFERGYGKNTGLGLFYVKEICAITGLEVKECGEMGVGAKFVISVPAGKWRNVNPA